MKYVYPAVFTPEGNDLYSVDFPDLHNCFTSGQRPAGCHGNGTGRALYDAV